MNRSRWTNLLTHKCTVCWLHVNFIRDSIECGVVTLINWVQCSIDQSKPASLHCWLSHGRSNERMTLWGPQFTDPTATSWATKGGYSDFSVVKLTTIDKTWQMFWHLLKLWLNGCRMHAPYKMTSKRRWFSILLYVYFYCYTIVSASIN